MAPPKLAEVAVLIRGNMDPLRPTLTQAQAEIIRLDREANQRAQSIEKSLSTMAQRSSAAIHNMTGTIQQSRIVLANIERTTGVGREFATAARAADIRAYGTALDDLRAKINPLFAAQREYLSKINEINHALRVGAITQAEHTTAINRTTQAYRQQIVEINRAGSGLSGLSAGFGMATRLAGAFGISLGTIGAVQFGRSVLSQADHLADLSDALEENIGFLSAWEMRAAAAGVKIEQADMALSRLSMTFGDAVRGGEASRKVFEALGIDVDKLVREGADLSDVVAAVNEGISKQPTAFAKASFAQDIYGRGMTRLLPLINEGKEGVDGLNESVGQFGVATSENAKAVDDWADRVSKRFTELKNEAVNLLGAFIRLQDAPSGPVEVALLKARQAAEAEQARRDAENKKAPPIPIADFDPERTIRLRKLLTPVEIKPVIIGPDEIDQRSIDEWGQAVDQLQQKAEEWERTADDINRTMREMTREVADIKPAPSLIEQTDAQVERNKRLVDEELKQLSRLAQARRKMVENADGSISTERTITIEVDERFYNIPTLIDGLQRSEQEAIDLWRDGLNNAVGVFDSLEEAIAAAEARSRSLGDVGEDVLTDLERDANLQITAQRKAFDEAIAASAAETKQLELQAETFNMTTRAAAQYLRERELINAALATGGPLTEAMVAQIHAEAVAYGLAAEHVEQLEIAAGNAQDNVSFLTGVAVTGFDIMTQRGAKLVDLLNDLASSFARAAFQALAFRAVTAALGLFSGTSAVSAAMPTDASLGVANIPIAHEGGEIGRDRFPTRRLPLTLFEKAPRYHKGLGHDEVPVVLQKGEKVLPKGWPTRGSLVSAIVAHAGARVGQPTIPTRLVREEIFHHAPRYHDGLMEGEIPAILEKGEKVLPKNWSAKGGGIVVNVTNNNDFSGTQTTDEMRKYAENIGIMARDSAIKAVEEGFSGYMNDSLERDF